MIFMEVISLTRNDIDIFDILFNTIPFLAVIGLSLLGVGLIGDVIIGLIGNVIAGIVTEIFSLLTVLGLILFVIAAIWVGFFVLLFVAID